MKAGISDVKREYLKEKFNELEANRKKNKH
jgi:hypothetical protein